MNKKKIYILGCILILIIILVIVMYNIKDNDEVLSNVDVIDSDIDLDNGDEDIDWTNLDNFNIELDNKSLDITKEGVYTITGNIDNGNIYVDTDSDVKLIFNNVSINNDTGPAIIIENANNIVIELAEGSNNVLSDGDNYSNTEYDGCLFSRDDLILQGTGSLKIVSNYLDGIVSNDDLKIVRGTYTINSSDDGIRGKDSVYIVDGNIDITSGADGIKSTNDTDSSKGYVNIENGTIKIVSKEDGIQAESKLIINNGTIEINKSYEGLEASNITINNGELSIISNDDGINISGGNDSSSQNGRPGQNSMPSSSGILTINNGKIYINATGDGLDANGSVEINGGTIYVDGPTDNGNGVLDYDISFNINGGEFIAVGSSGMSQNISDTSNQYSIMFNLNNTYSDKIELVDSNKKTIFEYTPGKKYQSIIISSSKLEKNNSYTLIIGEEEITTIDINSITNTSGNSFGGGQNMGGAGGPGGGHGGPGRR